MFNRKPQTRWQAFGIHLLVSFFLFICMCAIIVVFWYPGILFTTEGGWQGVRLIAGIDFVIGPILTLIVYKVGKPSLRFDLAVIGILQAICITYGMYVVNYSRPAVIAYADGIFYTTPLLRFDSRGIDVTQHPLLQDRMPIWVNIRLPENKADRLQVKIARLISGMETSTDLYEPYANAIPLLANEGFSLEEASKAGLSMPENINKIDTRVFKLMTRYGTHAVAVSVTDGKFIKLLGTVKPGELGLVLQE
jgi:hypothetical protein